MLAPLGIVPTDRDLKYIGSLFDGLAVVTGDRVRAALFGRGRPTSRSPPRSRPDRS